MESLHSWVQDKAYDTVLLFNLEHQLNLDEKQINKLLERLNQIFMKKKKKILQELVLNIKNKF